jgi:hypothetical protein
MPTKSDAEAFMNRLNSQIQSQGAGKMGIDVDALRAIVRENPEMTVAAAKTYLQMGRYGRGYYQVAVALATMYQAEFQDDSLAREMQRGLKAAGAGDAQPEVRANEAALEHAAPERLPGIQINIDSASLTRGDPYPLIRQFSVDQAKRADWPALAKLRGRCFLTFETRGDPREVWQVPEVRHFVAGLHAALPYFPYYLHPAPKMGFFLVYFGSMADDEALGAGPSIDLLHPSVLGRVVASLKAIVQLSKKLGEDPLSVCRHVLSGGPPEYSEQVLQAVGLAP